MEFTRSRDADDRALSTTGAAAPGQTHHLNSKCLFSRFLPIGSTATPEQYRRTQNRAIFREYAFALAAALSFGALLGGNVGNLDGESTVGLDGTGTDIPGAWGHKTTESLVEKRIALILVTEVGSSATGKKAGNMGRFTTMGRTPSRKT